MNRDTHILLLMLQLENWSTACNIIIKNLWKMSHKIYAANGKVSYHSSVHVLMRLYRMDNSLVC
jgi:hypothetical protein